MNAVEALKAYFPDAEGRVGPYGLLVGLAYLDENPKTEPERRVAVLELLDVLDPLAKTLTDEQLEQLCEVVISFFKFGTTLLMPHVVDAKEKAEHVELTLGVRNAARERRLVRIKDEATQIWADDPQLRVGGVAAMVHEHLTREGVEGLPKIEAIRKAIRAIAPPQAKKSGRPRHK